MKERYILGIDQGTTSNRAALFNCSSGQIVKMRAKEFTQSYPQDGWVEHDTEEIWEGVLHVVKSVLAEARLIPGFSSSSITAIGITNQRETTVVWEKSTGKPVYPAIVWQDRRTAKYCASLKKNGIEEEVTKKTGLPIDPYFCSTKIRWILDHVQNGNQRAKQGELAFGTIDSYLIWRLTSTNGLTGGTHQTDITNACRTNLFNIDTLDWDDDLLKIFSVPRCMLPDINPCNFNFGTTAKTHFGLMLPICGVAGDQQSSLFGQACFRPGMMKSTYGTGAFLLINSGEKRIDSRNKLLSTVAYQLKGEKVNYALEGSIFIAGAAIKWLKENMSFITDYTEIEGMVSSVTGNDSIYVVPAFSGLGAPHWDPEARGAIFGLTRNTSQAEIVKATLAAMAYQTSDIFSALRADGINPSQLKVDGGLSQSSWLLQFMANVLNIKIIVPRSHETTIIGACFLAALGANIYKNTEDIEVKWSTTKSYEPEVNFSQREILLSKWEKAITSTRAFTAC